MLGTQSQVRHLLYFFSLLGRVSLFGVAWAWGSVNLSMSPFLFVFFIPHLETLILVKVFPSWLVVQVDIYGAWWRGREDKPWKFLCCHFAHITLVQKIFGRVWEAAGTDIVTRFHGRGGACVKPGRIIKTIKGSEKTSFGLEISLKNIVEAGKKTVVFLMKAID